MAYKGFTVKFRISTNTGTYQTVNTLEEVEAAIERLKSYPARGWVAVDRIETDRIRLEELG